MVFTILLVLHVAIAGLGLAAGFVTMAAPKGRGVHRRAGKVFAVAMLTMTPIALVLALMRTDLISIVPPILTFYLVATAWRSGAGDPAPWTRVDAVLTGAVLVGAAIDLALGLRAAQGLHSRDSNGFPALAYFIFAGVCLMAALLDGRVLLGQTLFGKALEGGHRLARHLWRMSTAMFIATTSFFQGQAQVFPKALHGSVLLKLPALFVVAVMLCGFVWVALRGRRAPTLVREMAKPA